ncbi:hypothetical protein DXG01_005169 [Tephrocybe rancida]|nr:hypothetical protein DXG01_005169 [Tephrocybe rancida]
MGNPPPPPPFVVFPAPAPQASPQVLSVPTATVDVAMTDDLWPPPGLPMDVDDEDTVMDAPAAPLPVSTDIVMSDAPAAPSLLSRIAPAHIAPTSSTRGSKHGPRTSLPFAIVASNPAAQPHAVEPPRQPLQMPAFVPFALPPPPKPSSKFGPRQSLPFALVPLPTMATPQTQRGPPQSLPFALVPSTATTTPQTQPPASASIFSDCHIPLPALPTRYDTIPSEAQPAPIDVICSIPYYVQPPPLFASTSSSLSWSGSTPLSSSYAPRAPVESLFEQVLPPIDPEIKRRAQRERGEREAAEAAEREAAEAAEREARRVEWLDKAYASVICGRKRVREEEEEREVRIRSKQVTRPTKRLRTAVVEVVSGVKFMLAEAVVVVSDVVSVVAEVSKAALSCKSSVKKDESDDEDSEPLIPGAFPPDIKQEPDCDATLDVLTRASASALAAVTKVLGRVRKGP